MFNNNRLRLARKRNKLTAKKLAERANITSVQLSRIEQGVSEPTSDTISSLASALGYPARFLLGDDIDELAVEAASFRSLTSMTAGERDAALAAGSIAYLFCDWVSERFNLPSVEVSDLLQEKDPTIAARGLRDVWGLGEKPIPNMIKLLESKGIRVFSLAEETQRVDAFSCWRDGIPYIFLNTYKSAERSRFDAAHELGHLVLHRHGGPHQDRFVEKEADAFASSFLMPKSDVLSRVQFVNSIETLVAAKSRWGVSLAALVYRLHDLSIVSDWQNRMFNIQINKRGFRSSEPNPLERETSVVWKLVFAELWKDRISREHLADELAIPTYELDSLVFGLLSDIGSPDLGDSAALRVID